MMACDRARSRFGSSGLMAGQPIRHRPVQRALRQKAAQSGRLQQTFRSIRTGAEGSGFRRRLQAALRGSDLARQLCQVRLQLAALPSQALHLPPGGDSHAAEAFLPRLRAARRILAGSGDGVPCCYRCSISVSRLQNTSHRLAPHAAVPSGLRRRMAWSRSFDRRSKPSIAQGTHLAAGVRLSSYGADACWRCRATF